MYCLLCHEKIPRLRAWRTKSEFCSDEHAAQYKKQTLDRLLTDQNPARKDKPNPIAVVDEEEHDPFLHDEMTATPSVEPETVSTAAPEMETPSVFSEAQAAEMESFDLPDDGNEVSFDSQDGVEELWRMAEQVEYSGGESDFDRANDFDRADDTATPASRQSAEEALQALRMLASKASRNSADEDRPTGRQTTDSVPDEDEFAFNDIENLPPIGDDMMAELEGGFSFRDDSNEVEARKHEQPAAKPKPEPRDEEPSSILERLMEDPTADWRKPPSSERAASSIPDPPKDMLGPLAKSPDSLEDMSDLLDELPDSLANIPDPLEDLPDLLADFDGLPEPEFAFQDNQIDAKAQATDGQSEAESIEPESMDLDSSEPVSIEALESEDSEAVAEVDLADLEAALADDYDDPEIDPLAELIKAEEAAQASANLDEDGDLELDEAVADQLVNVLAEEAFRDDLDLQELERSLKVVPFPTPEREPAKNGHHSHAGEIVAKAVDDLDPRSESDVREPEETEARAKAPARRAQPIRRGRQRTKFKPSMIMAGIEPSLQGYLQGDPLESWRGKAVESAWGERGGPVAHSFEPPTADHLAIPGRQLEALRPERRYRAQLGISAALCTPAQGQAVDQPELDWKARRPDTAQQSPQSLSAEPQAWIRLGPEYKAFDDAVLVGFQTHDDNEAYVTPRAIEESMYGLQAPLAPGGLFFDSVSVEERFVDEEDWEDPAVSLGEPSQGIDLSEDFASEQPATQSSGGRRGR